MLWAFRCIVFARKWKNSSKNNASIYFCETELSELGRQRVNRPSDFDRIRSKASFIKIPCTLHYWLVCPHIFRPSAGSALHQFFLWIDWSPCLLFFKEYTYPDLRIYKDLKFEQFKMKNCECFWCVRN